jgi:hypothetical protein
VEKKMEKIERIVDLAQCAKMHAAVDLDEFASFILAELITEAEDLVDLLHEDALKARLQEKQAEGD